MLPLPVAVAKAPYQLPMSGNLSRAEALQTLGLLFALSVLSATGMIHQFYPNTPEGHITIADLTRNIGFGGGVFGFTLVLITRFFLGRDFRSPWFDHEICKLLGRKGSKTCISDPPNLAIL